MPFVNIACLVAVVVGMSGSAPRTLTGAFALQSAQAKTRGELRLASVGHDPLAFDLDYVSSRLDVPASPPISHYDVEMTKRMHLVIVGSDLRRFAHVHPTLARDGQFHIRYRFPAAGLYYVYADAVPHGVGQQVFRFDVRVGAAPAFPERPALGAPNATARVGPYTVTLDRATIARAGETIVKVHVAENGMPARDLHAYLGAPAHAVFVNARDLTYVHVHPLPAAASSDTGDAMGGMPAMAGMSGAKTMAMRETTPLSANAAVGPDMRLHVELAEAGTYALWLQFRGNGALRVASFVVVAR